MHNLFERYSGPFLLTAVLAGLWQGLGLASALAAGSGLTGEYFGNSDFTSSKFTRVDPTVNFNWGTAAPTNTMSAGAFSVRWTGQLEPRYSETYTFYVTADNGARLWVNDRLVLARTTYSAAALQMAGRINLQAGQRCNLALELLKTTGTSRVSLEWASASQSREIVPQSQLYPALGLAERGAIRVEHWLNLPGTNLAALSASTNFPNRPDSRDFLLSFECLQTNWADDYGTRVSGFILAPTNGSYLFAVAGDDATQLFLSTDTNAANKRLIASNNVPTGFRQFTSLASQMSAPVTLVAQQEYYVELLHKESTGNDHFSVAWQTPGATNFTVIPAEALVPAGLHLAPPAQANFLNTLCPSHPRLLASAERFEWLKRTVAANHIPQLTSWWGTLSNSASAILGRSVPTFIFDDNGSILTISRQTIDRVYKLALAWKMTGNSVFAERAWTELQQVCGSNFPDWHANHFLDTAEMTHACAIGYDWFYEYWTQSRRDFIRDAIISKGLNQSLSLYTNNSDWVACDYNWNQVCNGGMILGALAVGTENKPLAEYVLSKAVPSLNKAMVHFSTDNGGWYEGPAYWDYATDYNIRLMAGLESALGSDFSLSDTRGLAETGLQPLYTVGPTQLDFNFADCTVANLSGPQLFWLARRFARPEFSWWQRSNAGVETIDLLWYDSRGADPRTSGLQLDNCFRGLSGTTSYSPSGVVTLRSGWQDPQAAFLAFRSGLVGANHGHLDAGSFVLDALGMRWAHDLGGDDYSLSNYFNEPARWNYYRLRAEGHNTLVINPGSGADQTDGAKPPLILYTSEPNSDYGAVVADLSSAYGITKAWRGVQLLHGRRWMLVQDELQAASPANVWWFMHLNPATTAAIQTGGTSVMLTQGSERLWVNLLAGGGTFVLSNAVPLPTSPHPSGQNANTGYKKLAIHLTSVTNTTLAVLMVPLNAGDNPPTNMPALVALSDWGVGSTNNDVTPTNTPPATLAPHLTASAGGFLDVDLRTLAQDAETTSNNLRFAVGNAIGGTVTLLADGHTAHFVPATNFSGGAVFTYTVTDTWPDPRLLVQYDFEPPQTLTSGLVSDQSGHRYNGQLTCLGNGTNVLDPDTPPLLSPQSLQSLWLREKGDGNGACLTAPVPAAVLDFHTHDWTLAGWFKRATSTNDDFVFYLGDSDGFGSPDEFQVYCPGGQDNLVLRHYVANSSPDADLTSSTVLTGEWHHAAATYHSTGGNSGTLRLFLDGSEVGAGASVLLNMPADMTCVFGGHASTSSARIPRWFNGRLDDLAVFSAALSPGEIAQLAARPVAHLAGITSTNTVWIRVVSVSYPPVLAPLSNQTILAGTTLQLTYSATDPNTPPLPLRFSLLNAPAGASVDSASGRFAWRPTIAQSGTSNFFGVVVTENGGASLSATQSLWVKVLAPAPPSLEMPQSSAGQFRFTVQGDAGPDYLIEASTNLAQWFPIFTTNSPALPWSWTEPNTNQFPLRFYRVRLGP